MADGVDKALDLADRWAQQIGDQITKVAPGATDVAMEAVKVQILAKVFVWPLFIVCCLVFAYVSKRLWAKAYEIIHGERASTDEEFPYQLCGAISALIAGGMLIATLVNFPAKELAGLYAPRGYLALMVLDRVK